MAFVTFVAIALAALAASVSPTNTPASKLQACPRLSPPFLPLRLWFIKEQRRATHFVLTRLLHGLQPRPSSGCPRAPPSRAGCCRRGAVAVAGGSEGQTVPGVRAPRLCVRARLGGAPRRRERAPARVLPHHPRHRHVGAPGRDSVRAACDVATRDSRQLRNALQAALLRRASARRRR